ncbi:kinase-like protein [Calocera cornea HHB12733]|uniref:Kinase-like protein n=1 Tax=Calocera cornea HHB12733 TaxID=1353952 RepID=A0A165IQ51_9BASI|nr:kinase-like protein [Calocera cornea HHB12733]
MEFNTVNFRPPADLWKDVPFLARLWLAVPTPIRLTAYRLIWWVADKLHPRAMTTRVHRIFPGIYLKYGFVRSSEPHAMILLRRHTKLHSSIVLDYVTQTEHNTNVTSIPYTTTFLLMTAARGQSLMAVEDQLTPEQIKSIGLELRDYLVEMHKIPNPYKYGLCSSDGRGLDAPRFGGSDIGPCENIRSFHSWLYRRMGKHWPTMQPRVQPIFDKYDERCTIFSHGDLSSDNIMVHDGRLSGLIDWETSGWMPPYWDFFCARIDSSEACKAIVQLAIPEHVSRERYELYAAVGVMRGLSPKMFPSFEEANVP